MSCKPARAHRPTRCRRGWTGALCVLLALQGCASAPAPSPSSVPPSATAAPPALPQARRNSAVAIERQWLQSWFEGTPVRIEQRSETSFSVDVPRDFCFEAGRSEVRAPLAAVLDKVAQSLQRKPALRVTWLAAPGDASAAPALAQQRAGNVRKHLLARGAAADQLAVASVTQAAAVQLRIGADAP